MRQDHTVLIGSAGTGTAFGAICALRKIWSTSIKIIAMDTNPPHLCTASLLADAYELALPFKDPEYSNFLKKTLRKYKIDTYLPLNPLEIKIASKIVLNNPNLLAYPKTIPCFKAAEACNDKLKLYKILDDADIPVPKIYSANKTFAQTRVFVKPRSATGGFGAKQMTHNELNQVPKKEKKTLVIQDVCFHPEITIDAFFEKSVGHLHSVCRERIETKSGVATKCRLFKSGKINKIAKSIASKLCLEGSFCFQLMHNQKNRLVVTDVNPRPGAATAMSVATGNDFFAATFANAWGLDCDQFFKPLLGDIYVTRQYSEFVMTGEVPE